jgi:deoxycytidine triphosphate deaminase
MFVNPKLAIENGWLKFPEHTVDAQKRKCIQPNAVDFTLDVVHQLAQNIASISEFEKHMRDSQMMLAEGGWWDLKGQSVYDGMSNMYVEVPDGHAAILYTRSTFARNGVFVMSGLYDSGFKGNIGFTIYTVGGPIHIEQGTRIGQIAFVTSENAGIYAGGWNHERDTLPAHLSKE